MADAIFDQFAQNYEDVHTKSITLSGEESIFFVELKMKLLSDYLDEKVVSPLKTLKIVDYGCGTGRAASFVKHYFPQSSFIGVDPSLKSIEVARKHFPEDTFQVLGTDGSIPEKEVDIIFAAGVFHHIPEAEQAGAVQHIMNALKPGGYFVLFEHNPYNPLTVRVVKSCPFDEGVILLKPKLSRSLLQGQDLLFEHQRYYFFFPNFLSFLRPLERWLRWMPLGAQYMIVARKPEAIHE